MSTTDRAPCPDIGVWRAWLDNEDAATQPISIEEHLADCPACRRLVAELREDASDVRDILSVLAPTRLPNAAEVALARERLDWRGRRPAQPAQPVPIRSLEPTPMFFTRLSTPWRVAAGGIAAGLVIALLVAFTPQGSSVAAAFLSQFRSQQVTAIEITPQTQADIYKTLNALGNLGTVHAPGVPGGQARPETAIRAAEQQTHSVSLAEAAQTIGKAYFLTPDPAALPAGMDKTPNVRVMPGTQVRFTFDKKKAESYLQSQSNSQQQVNVPDKYDGSSLVVSIPTAVALEYGDKSSKTALVVAEAGEVVVDTEGKVSLSEMRDYLLSMPLPPVVVNQLKQINSWSDTLPIPVPVDQIHWQKVTIKGNQALLLNDNSGVGSAVIWHADGHLYGVAGSVKAKDLQQFAESLAVR